MRLVLAKKIFPTFKCIVTSQSPGIAMRFQRRKLPALHVIKEGGNSLFGSHGKGPELGCLIAIREYQPRP